MKKEPMSVSGVSMKKENSWLRQFGFIKGEDKVKIKAITKTHCFKCEWAKEKLKDYPIQWLDFDRDEEARDLSEKYNLDMVPVFLIFQDGGNVVTTRSVLSVRKFIE